ncbi:MAG: DUF4333 domain-containing protein [Actinomycetota bacterium]|nr:DUF4333 domain-containing protein [Actinomycetota bacterium]
MKPRRLIAALAAALLVALPLTGCGTKKLNTDKAEAEIEKGLKQQLRLPTVDVKCPQEVEIKAMARFDCPVTAGTEKGTINVVQQDDQGNIRWQLKQQGKQR